jgi:hypothetical protein
VAGFVDNNDHIYWILLFLSGKDAFLTYLILIPDKNYFYQFDICSHFHVARTAPFPWPQRDGSIGMNHPELQSPARNEKSGTKAAFQMSR